MQVVLPILSSLAVARGLRVLVRGSLNVPLNERGEPQNTLRLHRMVPTIRWLRQRGASVVLCGHRGRSGDESLAPLAEWFAKELGEAVVFAPTIRDAHRLLGDGVSLILLENLRCWEGEKANDLHFARALAGLADAYVNEAFAASHRAHASIVSVPKLLPAYAGFAFQREVEMLTQALEPPAASFLIVGGAKIATKLPLLLRALTRYRKVAVGGVLANDLWAAKGYEVGRSMRSAVSPEALQPLLRHPRVVLPVDVVAYHPVHGARVCAPTEVAPEERIVDAGPRTVALFAGLAEASELVVWNGPLGNYEQGFAANTEALAQALTRVSARTIIGGGDTVASIERMQLVEHFTFVSTGGGAMLQFLADGTLPGITALQQTLE